MPKCFEKGTVNTSNDCFESKSHLQSMSSLISEKSLRQSLEGIIGKQYILCDYDIIENLKVPFMAKVDWNLEKFIPINKSSLTESLKATEEL